MGDMGARFKSDNPRGAHFIRAWRKMHNYKLDKMAADLDIDRSSLSRIERGEQPYSEDFLTACAVYLHCSPAALIGWEPGPTEDLFDIWQDLSEDDQERVIAMLKGLRASKKSPDTISRGNGGADRE
jgi:transcriptional regulator with XRE-family HTH domain